jgi:prevent-host-death family protein
MSTVNMLEAKTHLSRLVEAVETGDEAEIIIARNGKPAAKLVPVSKRASAGKRLGLLRGKFPSISQCDFNSDDEMIGAMIDGGGH